MHKLMTTIVGECFESVFDKGRSRTGVLIAGGVSVRNGSVPSANLDWVST